jgi:hypothetical protein
MQTMTPKQIHDYLINNPRLTNYRIYEELYKGDHYSAFSIKSEDFTKDYAKLRYIVANFAGLISKVIADMLFGEPVTIQDTENQDWLDALTHENNLDELFYEHALANSYFGDNLFKIRVEDNILKIEEAPPSIYIPELNPGNVAAPPQRINLAIPSIIDGDKYYIIETHEPPTITTRIVKIDDKGEVLDIDINKYNELTGTKLQEVQDTKISRFLVIHVPNPKPRGHFGQSDYLDLKTLFFALNNRMTKIDNILDKHSDPILAVPEGVLDEEGQPHKQAFNLFEVPENGDKPEYVVWNANLDIAFTQIDKLVEMLFMFSETSPDSMGLGKSGIAESGRALKMRLIRTIAKRNRKKLYYDRAIKELIYTAQLLAKANPGVVPSKDIKTQLKEPTIPRIIWQDGIANDEVERTDIALKRVDAGVKSKKQAIIELEDITEDEALEQLDEIEKYNKQFDFTSFIDEKEKE